jgi:tRNA(adenine34) deaminase
MSFQLHEHFMELALREARKAYEQKEIPVGAVIVHDNAVIGRGYNQTEHLQDPTAHAEILAITAAATTLGSRRLEDCTMYVTLEPCAMCAGAIVQARIPVLVFGAYDAKAGACGTLFNIVQDKRLNHRVNVVPGILESASTEMLRQFFGIVRKEA